MEYGWRELIPLLPVLDSRVTSVEEAIVDSFVQSLKSATTLSSAYGHSNERQEKEDELQAAFHALIFEVAFPYESIINAPDILHRLVSTLSITFANRLLSLLQQDGSGSLILVEELDMEKIFRMSSIHDIQLRSEDVVSLTPHPDKSKPTTVSSSVYGDSWMKTQRKKLKSIIKQVALSTTELTALKYLDSSLGVDYSMDLDLDTYASTQDKSTSIQHSNNENNISWASHRNNTQDSWFVRILRFLLISLLDKDDQKRQLAAHLLQAILVGLQEFRGEVKFPKYLTQDVLSLSLVVLSLDDCVVLQNIEPTTSPAYDNLCTSIKVNLFKKYASPFLHLPVLPHIFQYPVKEEAAKLVTFAACTNNKIVNDNSNSIFLQLMAMCRLQSDTDSANLNIPIGGMIGVLAYLEHHIYTENAKELFVCTFEQVISPLCSSSNQNNNSILEKFHRRKIFLLILRYFELLFAQSFSWGDSAVNITVLFDTISTLFQQYMPIKVAANNIYEEEDYEDDEIDDLLCIYYRMSIVVYSACEQIVSLLASSSGDISINAISKCQVLLNHLWVGHISTLWCDLRNRWSLTSIGYWKQVDIVQSLCITITILSILSNFASNTEEINDVAQERVLWEELSNRFHNRFLYILNSHNMEIMHSSYIPLLSSLKSFLLQDNFMSSRNCWQQSFSLFQSFIVPEMYRVPYIYCTSPMIQAIHFHKHNLQLSSFIHSFWAEVIAFLRPSTAKEALPSSTSSIGESTKKSKPKFVIAGTKNTSVTSNNSNNSNNKNTNNNSSVKLVNSNEVQRAISIVILSYSILPMSFADEATFYSSSNLMYAVQELLQQTIISFQDFMAQNAPKQKSKCIGPQLSLLLSDMRFISTSFAAIVKSPVCDKSEFISILLQDTTTNELRERSILYSHHIQSLAIATIRVWHENVTIKKLGNNCPMSCLLYMLQFAKVVGGEPYDETILYWQTLSLELQMLFTEKNVMNTSLSDDGVWRWMVQHFMPPSVAQLFSNYTKLIAEEKNCLMDHENCILLPVHKRYIFCWFSRTLSATQWLSLVISQSTISDWFQFIFHEYCGLANDDGSSSGKSLSQDDIAGFITWIILENSGNKSNSSDNNDNYVSIGLLNIGNTFHHWLFESNNGLNMTQNKREWIVNIALRLTQSLSQLIASATIVKSVVSGNDNNNSDNTVYDIWLTLAIQGLADYCPSVRYCALKMFQILIPLSTLGFQIKPSNTGDKNGEKDTSNRNCNSAYRLSLRQLLAKSHAISYLDSLNPLDQNILHILQTQCLRPQGIAYQRSYQWEAVQWWTSLRRCGLGGILADEMGLGKTLQALLCLAILRLELSLKDNHSSEAKTFLPLVILCPATLTHHWQQEIHKHFYSLEDVIDTSISTSRKRIFHPLILESKDFAKYRSNSNVSTLWSSLLSTYDTFILSYDTFRTYHSSFFHDKKNLKGLKPHCVILDEAHLLRNPNSLLTQSILQVPTTYRLALTGTPIQNQVQDIWSLMHFLVPGYLGDYRGFRKHYVHPVQRSMKALKWLSEHSAMKDHTHENARHETARHRKQQVMISAQGIAQLHHLHRLILPFILRREKRHVLQDLPAKVIVDVACPLSSVQKEWYDMLTHRLKQRYVKDDTLQLLENYSMHEKDTLSGRKRKRDEKNNNDDSNNEEEQADEDEKDVLALYEDIVHRDDNYTNLNNTSTQEYTAAAEKAEANDIFNLQFDEENTDNHSVGSDTRVVTTSLVPLNPLHALSCLQRLSVHPALVIDAQLHAAYRHKLVSDITVSGKLLRLAHLLFETGILMIPTFNQDDDGKHATVDDEEERNEDTNKRIVTYIHQKKVVLSVSEWRQFIEETLFFTGDTASLSVGKMQEDEENSDDDSNKRETDDVENLMLVDSSDDEEDRDERDMADASAAVSPVVPSLSRKCLIFAQHVATLDLIEEIILQPLGYRKYNRNSTSNNEYFYGRLDGSMKPSERFEIANLFSPSYNNSNGGIINSNNDSHSHSSNKKMVNMQILLLTTRACGLGLNLTAADTVIFVEHDWNPAQDLQAMDRVHRLGQKHPVTVYRLLSEDTVDDRLVQVQFFKQDIASRVILGMGIDAGQEKEEKNVQNDANNRLSTLKKEQNWGKLLWESLTQNEHLQF